MDIPVYLPSHLESLKKKLLLKYQISKPKYRDIIILIIGSKNILQIKQFQYRFFQNIILNEDTVRQIKVFSHFVLKFFRFNYQLIWEQLDQNAYINFPQVLTETELLPLIIRNPNKHVQYRDPTSFDITFFELINFDNNFITEPSETSDHRPYTNPNLISEPSPDEHNPHMLQHDPEHNILQPNQDDTKELFQN